MTIENFALATAVVSIVFALWLRRGVKKQSEGDEKMKEIAEAIREGSKAFLKRQFKSIFVVGAVASSLAAFLGMQTAVMANSRVTEAAKRGLRPAFQLAFRGGAVTGFLVVGLGLLVVAGFWSTTENLRALIGLGFGGSLISVFSRLGGGIYTKAADVGADLVGKTEAGIPEDDPRNPAVIADNVGDNVGDCAGMAADLFETYTVTLIAGMLLGGAIFMGSNAAILLPILLGGTAIWASIIGFYFVRVADETKIMWGLYKGLIASGILSALGFYWGISRLVSSPGNGGTDFFTNIVKIPGKPMDYFLASLVGLVVVLAIVLITEYYTSKKFRPVKSIAKSSESGHGTNVIMGLAMSLESTALPSLVIAFGAYAAFQFAGLYGVALAAVSMLSMAGIIVAIDSFGPITDNAGGIAEMAGLSKSVRAITDPLDAVGNTTKAITKGYAIASAGLAAIVLFAAYTTDLVARGLAAVFDLSDPLVVTGLFLGGMLPYVFASLAMRSEE